MISAKALSEKIRMKRKTVKADGVDNMVDTDPHPQMNPQDILNLKQEAQMDETMDLPEKSTAPSDPADADISDTSQEKEFLKKRMGRVRNVFNKLG
jgi:hypothetical protein